MPEFVPGVVIVAVFAYLLLIDAVLSVTGRRP